MVRNTSRPRGFVDQVRNTVSMKVEVLLQFLLGCFLGLGVVGVESKQLDEPDECVVAHLALDLEVPAQLSYLLCNR